MLEKPSRSYVTGSNWGLACNSIHFIDFHEWLTNSKLVEVDISGLENIWFESKRKGNFEVFGEIKCVFSDNSEMTLNVTKEGRESYLISLDNLEHGNNYLINEMENNLKIDGDDIYLGDMKFQSQETGKIIDKIINKGHCDLPTLVESIETHNIFIRSLLVAWSRFKKVEEDTLPIT